MTEAMLFSVLWRSAVLRHGRAEWGSTLRLVLLVIGGVVLDEKGTVEISMQRIAQYSGLTPDTVQRRLAKAFASGTVRGWLTRRKIRNQYGHRSYVYQCHIPADIDLRRLWFEDDGF